MSKHVETKKPSMTGHPAAIGAHPIPAADGARKEARVPVETIRARAYAKWEAAGRPAGDGVAFWLDAERELSQPR
jgi:hypothetical protein